MSPSKNKAASPAGLEALLEYIRTSRGFDFSGYKRPTLARRIARRMLMLGVGSFEEYQDGLEAQPEEFGELFNTILINVTSLFRDPSAWEAIATEVIPKIIGKPSSTGEVRVWSAGCASGEEPCTLAILLADALGDDAFRKRVKIYATDVDEEALAHARRAAYTEKEMQNVPRKFRRKYFEPQEGKFALRSDLRRAIIFGRHDLMQDAPISRVDLLTCRNTLMYFNADAQARITSRLHFALRDTGFIFLGKAEMLQGQADLFAPMDLKHRIFSKVPGSRARELGTPTAHAARAEALPVVPTLQTTLRGAAFDAGPVPQIVIDADGTLAGANREARSLFALTFKDVGQPFKDLEVSYRPVELRSHVEQVLRTHQQAILPDVSWTTPGGEVRHLRVHLAPLAGATEAGCLGVVISIANVTLHKTLEAEVLRSRQELDTASEELQSANEELETTNEELQSTNEELETMNEELQSTNQELHAVNDELSKRTEEAGDANAFLTSVLTGLNSGVAVVNAGFIVEQWNHRCEDLWGLRADEVVGKHLLNLDVGLPVDLLKAPVKAVLNGRSENRGLTLESVNRRGRKIRCRVTCTPRLGAKKEIKGVILLMEQLGEPKKKDS